MKLTREIFPLPLLFFRHLAGILVSTQLVPFQRVKEGEGFTAQFTNVLQM